MTSTKDTTEGPRGLIAGFEFRSAAKKKPRLGHPAGGKRVVQDVVL